MKSSFKKISKAWDDAGLSSETKEEFQAKWTKALEEHGWTREEFHTVLSYHAWENANAKVAPKTADPPGFEFFFEYIMPVLAFASIAALAWVFARNSCGS